MSLASIPPEVSRELQDLRSGRIWSVGEFSMAVAPATSTTVTRLGVSSGSVVNPVPYNAAAATEGIPRIVPATDAFTVYHSSSAGVRTYRYSFMTGPSTTL